MSENLEDRDAIIHKFVNYSKGNTFEEREELLGGGNLLARRAEEVDELKHAVGGKPHLSDARGYRLRRRHIFRELICRVCILGSKAVFIEPLTEHADREEGRGEGRRGGRGLAGCRRDSRDLRLNALPRQPRRPNIKEALGEGLI